MTTPPLSSRAPAGLAQRAKPHSRRALAPLFLALAAGLATSCSPNEGHASEQATGEDPILRLAELTAAFEPVPLEATSDRHDRALARQRELLESLRVAGPAMGKAALAAYRAGADERDDLRRAFLDVAAHGDPETTASVLEHMIVTYDAQTGLGLRTFAVDLLSRTSPERALALIGPLLSEPPNATMPPVEALVRGWAHAARTLETTDVRVLADLATDFTRPPDARYAATSELGRMGGPLAEKALEVVLFEASSDAMLRRKAAQAMQKCLEPARLCPILERAASHEHDEFFLSFLADMIAKSCP